MKILSLHTDYIKFKPLKKALKSVEELKDKAEKEEKEALVIFTAVEKTDEQNIEKIIDLLVENIKDLAKQVGAKNIVLYPYAHLSSDLASPGNAEKVLAEAEKKLKKVFNIVRAPFGYYKEFELKCKGHPLAELSRTISLLSQKEAKDIELKDKEKPLTDSELKNLLREISRTKLDTTKLKDNDHRILGQKLDLFSFNESAPGMVFWHNNGLIIRNELINFWREEHRKAGYKEIETPLILDKKLWKISGHWDKYKENIFLTLYEGREFAVKPMNCPGGMLVYKATPKSYKELPLRVAELGVVHRQELSGVLAGLFRVIKFTQDDAHIFCTEKHLEDEIQNIMNLIDRFYEKFGFTYHVELSTRPEKRIGNDKTWNIAEKSLEKILKKNKVKYKTNKGEGAFYGPKIDFHIEDSLKRTWQLATIQLDFAMPERFELTYKDEKNKDKTPIMLHRVIYGSLERFIGILLEHTNGNLPVWLSPIQARIISFTDRNKKAVEDFAEKLKLENIRVDIDIEDETVGSKVRDASMSKIPFIIVVGDKEEEKSTLAIRTRDGKVRYNIKPEEFIREIKELIEKRI